MIVFFDIDDTVYDRSMPFIEAAKAYFGRDTLPLKEAYAFCTVRGNEVFHASQRGDISMEEMYIYRYCKGFADAGIEITPQDALKFQTLYREAQGRITMTGTMREILRLCKEAFEGTGIITNGPSDKQRGKINTLGLNEYFREEYIIISGETGIDKPDPGIFNLARERCGGRTENLLYVGDLPEHDIIPASRLGWKTLWFNRAGLKYPAGEPEPDKSADTEEELLRVLKEYAEYARG